MKRLLTTLFALALALTGPGLVTESGAQIVETFDFVFDINVVNPDPLVWATSGNISPRGIEGRGLQITDLGEANSLLYFHAASEIGGSDKRDHLQRPRAHPADPGCFHDRVVERRHGVSADRG